MGKRMNIMWIPLQPWIRSPPFSGSRDRPINPMPREMKLLATSSGWATIVPSCFVSRKTLSPYYSLRHSSLALVLEGVDDDDDGRPHQHDEEGREDAADHREQHFQ